MLTYWEQQSFTHYHHIVAGAGIVGLSAAIELKAKFPGQRVLVLERGVLPTGASTRNAGFACMGSATELLDDLNNVSEAEAVRLFAWRKKGLELLRVRLGDDKIGYKENGSYELISAREAYAMEKLERLNEVLLPLVGKPAYKLADDKIAVFGFDAFYTQSLIENTCEGELHSGMMMRALTDLAIEKGIEIKTGADIAHFEEHPDRVEVFINDPFRKDTYGFTCNTFSICTNAFTKQLLPDVHVEPGRGQVLITHPVKGLKFKGIYHFDMGYYYFRELDGRVLLGGGRNLDFKTENTTSFDFNDHIQADLERKLKDIILPQTPFTIDRRWTGIMAFGPNKFPVVQAFSPRVYGAFRMGGMGVALGSEAARMMVEMISI